MFINLKRIIKASVNELKRNISLFFSTVLIMVTVVSLITVFYFINEVSAILIADVENKVDVSIYFVEDVTESQIAEVGTEISNISQVKEVKFVPKDEVLAEFISIHRDDPEVIESLTELGYNPFLDTLNIKTHEPSQYSSVTELIESSNYAEIIHEVDYHRRKESIESVYALTGGINTVLIFLGVIFALIAISISFNTVRIAIYNSREEISVMKLVGASNKFVRGPFIMQGILIGLVSGILTFILTVVVSYFGDSLMAGISIFSIFTGNILLILLIQMLSGVVLGVISSYIAIRKHLRV